MIYSSDHIQELINDFIEKLPFDRKPASLYEPIRYTLSAGGKRMRPTLMLMAYNLYKDDPASILYPATGLEIYHNYTLLHDDLMDKSDLRRGRPTVHKKWNDNTAILSGDSMLVLAYEYFQRCNKEVLPLVLSSFTETALQIGEGQQFDMDFEERNYVTEAEYIEMIRLKTSVLLGCAMEIGGILAGASDDERQLLYNIGQSVGLAFQLQDDYLDVYGDEATFGKPIGGDISNNKKTYMLINAQLRATGADKEDLERWLTAKDFSAKEKIDFYFQEAEKLIDKISLPVDRKGELCRYVGSLRDRKL